MGYNTLMLLVAALLTGTSLVVTSSSGSIGDTQVDEQTLTAIARDASLAGLRLSTQKLAADTGSWYADPSRYEFDDESWKYSSFSTSVETLYVRGPEVERCAIDTVDVISMGESLAGLVHTATATYVRTCSAEGLPDGIRMISYRESSHQPGPTESK